MPVLLKAIVDSLDRATAVLVVPLALLVAYGLLRLSTTVFTELREFLFAKVTQRAVRTIALEVFRHLHALSLRFHLHAADGRPHARRRARPARHLDADQLSRCSRSCRRWSRSAWSSAILIARYDWTFIAITAGALALYIAFTVLITEWRTHFRRHDERARFEGEHARDRQPAQLRDGQVLRQRGVGGAPLRREHAALGEGGGEEPDVAVGAQRQAERDHRDRRDADHVAGDGRGRRRHDDASATSCSSTRS